MALKSLTFKLWSTLTWLASFCLKLARCKCHWIRTHNRWPSGANISQWDAATTQFRWKGYVNSVNEKRIAHVDSTAGQWRPNCLIVVERRERVPFGWIAIHWVAGQAGMRGVVHPKNPRTHPKKIRKIWKIQKNPSFFRGFKIRTLNLGVNNPSISVFKSLFIYKILVHQKKSEKNKKNPKKSKKIPKNRKNKK